MKIAIIPARGGSRRIPNKNIRLFINKPVIAYSIECAIQSGLFDRIIVSTDHQEIGNIAKKYGAEVPFLRPTELADDYSSTTAVIAHSIKWLNRLEVNPTLICCIYPTAPFIQTTDLHAGLRIIEEGKWRYVFSATTFPSTVFRSFTINDNGGIEMLFPEHYSTRSQDLPLVMHDAGQFYWGRSEAWLNEERIFSPFSTTLFIPHWRVQDLDTEDDWIRAEIGSSAIFDMCKKLVM